MLIPAGNRTTYCLSAANRRLNTQERMTDQTDKSITLTRTIEAPVEELFAAWTDPALLEQWQAERVEFEPFEGGTFRFETDDEDEPGLVHVVTGRVVAFEQDRKLIEVWRYDGDDEVDESTLIVTFSPLDEDRTEVTLVEVAEAHSDPESRIFSIEAWDAALEELADLLE